MPAAVIPLNAAKGAVVPLAPSSGEPPPLPLLRRPFSTLVVVPSH